MKVAIPTHSVGIFYYYIYNQQLKPVVAIPTHSVGIFYDRQY